MIRVRFKCGGATTVLELAERPEEKDMAALLNAIRARLFPGIELPADTPAVVVVADTGPRFEQAKKKAVPQEDLFA